MIIDDTPLRLRLSRAPGRARGHALIADGRRYLLHKSPRAQRIGRRTIPTSPLAQR